MPENTPTKTALINLPNGRKIPLEFPDSPLMEIAVREMFTSQYPMIPFLKPRGAAILDIGANIGGSTLRFALDYPGATVYALEPAAEPFSYLARNLATFPQVKCFQIGAFDRDATAQFFPGKKASVTGSLVPGGEASDVAAQTVQLRRISTFVKELGIGEIVMLKVDTEGAEVPILADLQPIFDRVQFVYLEYHSESDRRQIDAMLDSHFMHFYSRANSAHRGVVGYCAHRILAEQTAMYKLPISRPVVE